MADRPGNTSTERSSRSRPYAIVHEGLKSLLVGNAHESEIGMSVAAVMRLFEVSRPSAERALEALVSGGIIEQAQSGKFRRPALAGRGGEGHQISLEDLVGTLPEDVVDTTRQRGSWLHLYDEVQQVVVQFTPFGSFRVNESMMATHFGVSRTVTNEVLGRLEERGLIARGAKGRWRIQQLSRKQIRNLYQLRRALEPVALAESGPQLDAEFIAAAIRRIEEAAASEISLAHNQADDIEHDLHIAALRRCSNDRLLDIVRNCQVLRISHTHNPIQAASKPERDQYLHEHRLVFDALKRGAWKLAEEALVHHLDKSLERAIVRLEQAAATEAPPVPAFLTAEPDEE